MCGSCRTLSFVPWNSRRPILLNPLLTDSQDNPRTISALVAAKANDVDVELVETQANANADFNKSAEYIAINPAGKIPAFKGTNGYTLSEAIALNVYRMWPFLPRLHSYTPPALLL